MLFSIDHKATAYTNLASSHERLPPDLPVHPLEASQNGITAPLEGFSCPLFRSMSVENSKRNANGY